jgi:hypothetical protein
MDREAQHVLEGKEPMAALHDVLHAAVAHTGAAVQGYVFETNDLTHAKVPDELLQEGPLQIALTVTHHRPEGAAWGQYVVLIVSFPSGATAPVTASNERLDPGARRVAAARPLRAQ